MALFFVQSHTKQQVKRAAVGAEGYVLDPFSHDAVATHLKAVGEPLVKAFGAYAAVCDLFGFARGLWGGLDAAVAGGVQEARGYDLMPHLAELVAGGTPAAEKVRHDYGVTLTELVNENYLTQINDWAKAHGTKFRSQTYGEPAVSIFRRRIWSRWRKAKGRSGGRFRRCGGLRVRTMCSGITVTSAARRLRGCTRRCFARLRWI